MEWTGSRFRLRSRGWVITSSAGRWQECRDAQSGHPPPTLAFFRKDMMQWRFPWKTLNYSLVSSTLYWIKKLDFQWWMCRRILRFCETMSSSSDTWQSGIVTVMSPCCTGWPSLSFWSPVRRGGSAGVTLLALEGGPCVGNQWTIVVVVVV